MSVPTDQRLRQGRDVVATLRARRQRSGALLAVHLRDRQVPHPARIAVVASRRVGSAVERNRAKRLLREAARRVGWHEGLDVVIVARAACAESRLLEVRRELFRLATELGAVVPPGAEA